MALSNQDNPVAAKPPTSATKPAATTAPPALAKAATSGDPTVHKLVADRHLLALALAEEEHVRDDVVADLRERIAGIDADLAALGYAV